MTRQDWPVFEDNYELREWKIEHGYVACDSLDCEAKDQPQTDWEYKQAYGHWRYHQYLAGCSHAR